MTGDPVISPPPPASAGAFGERWPRILAAASAGAVLLLILFCAEMERRHRREVEGLREEIAEMLRGQRALAARESGLLSQEAAARRMKAALEDAWNELKKVREQAAAEREEARRRIAELEEKLAAAEQAAALLQAAAELPPPPPPSRPAAAGARRGR